MAHLVDYWGRAFPSRVAEHVANAQGDARERLLLLMEYLLEHDSARYDVAFRAWAAQEPAVARRVRRVDQQRLRVVRSLFKDMGFSGTELEMRASTFVVFHSLERGMARSDRRSGPHRVAPPPDALLHSAPCAPATITSVPATRSTPASPR